MTHAQVIIVTGLSATGKTTIGQEIARALGLPFLNKDTLKEMIFDNLGWKDRDWSNRVGAAAYAILDYLAEQELSAGRSFVLESNFHPKRDSQKYGKLLEKYHTSAVQVVCKTDPEVLLERFKQRAVAKKRHPGHVDMERLHEWEKLFASQTSGALAIAGKVIEVNTTDFSLVDLPQIIEQVKKYLD